MPPALSARNPPAAARGSSDSAITSHRSPLQQTLPSSDLEDALSKTSESIDGQAATEFSVEDSFAPNDGEAAGEPDGVQNRDALAATMDAERRQLAEMFDEIDASGASAALEAVALANTEDETLELEQDVQQLQQSIAGIKSAKGNKLPTAAGGERGSAASSEILPSRLGTSRGSRVGFCRWLRSCPGAASTTHWRPRRECFPRREILSFVTRGVDSL